MIRGSTFSVILHGGLLALLLFGLPHFLFLTEDEPSLESKGIEVAPATPEVAAAIDKAAARPLAEILAAAAGRGLLADAINTESDAGQRSKLQSAAGSNSLTQAADDKVDEQSQSRNQSVRNPVDAQNPVDQVRAAEASDATSAQSPSGQAAQQRSTQEASASVARSQQSPI